MADVVGGCLASILTQIQYNICNARQYGTDSSCADNCCRFNCCWKNGALPVEDYPIANSSADDGTQTVDGGVDGTKEDTEAGSLPAYTATPQMSASAAATAPTDTKTTAEQQTSQP